MPDTSRTSRVYGALLALALAGPAIGADEIREETVRFEKGATSATRKGTLKGYGAVHYRLGAAAGQVMTVTLKTSNRQNYFNVMPPAAPEALFVGSSAPENRWSGTLPESGDYTVQVYLMRAAARRNETARYTVTFTVTQAPKAAAAGPARDALVKGTPFHATGNVRCGPEGGKAPSQCPFGVVRRGSGEADVHVTLPNGTRRVLLFRGDRVTLAGDGGSVTASRRGDNWIVRAAGDEFEIPDAVVLGG